MLPKARNCYCLCAVNVACCCYIVVVYVALCCICVGTHVCVCVVYACMCCLNVRVLLHTACNKAGGTNKAGRTWRCTKPAVLGSTRCVEHQDSRHKKPTVAAARRSPREVRASAPAQAQAQARPPKPKPAVPTRRTKPVPEPAVPVPIPAVKKRARLPRVPTLLSSPHPVNNIAKRPRTTNTAPLPTVTHLASPAVDPRIDEMSQRLVRLEALLTAQAQTREPQTTSMTQPVRHVVCGCEACAFHAALPSHFTPPMRHPMHRQFTPPYYYGP